MYSKPLIRVDHEYKKESGILDHQKLLNLSLNHYDKMALTSSHATKEHQNMQVRVSVQPDLYYLESQNNPNVLHNYLEFRMEVIFCHILTEEFCQWGREAIYTIFIFIKTICCKFTTAGKILWHSIEKNLHRKRMGAVAALTLLDPKFICPAETPT